MHNDAAIHHDARGDTIEPTISQRVIRMGRQPQRWFHHVILLAAGTMTLARNETAVVVQGPALVFFPPSEGESATIAAGAHGYLIGVSPEIIGEAIGDHAESPSLRLFSCCRISWRGSISKAASSCRCSKASSPNCIRKAVPRAWWPAPICG